MKSKLLALSVLAALPLCAFASDGDITFNGKVVAAACTLKGIDGGTQTTGAIVALPDVTPSSFSSAGGYAGMTDFIIGLKNCDNSVVKNARVSFSGTPDPDDITILQNTASAPATGVGVAILENDGTTLAGINGQDPAQKQALSVGDTDLKFKVAYKTDTTTPAVTAGNVSAKSYIDISYE